jgi:putative ABC transport system permease protein
MGIPIRRGRPLSDLDTKDAPRVLLVNEALTRQYFPNEDPIGRLLTDRGTIVGVVGDVRQSSLEHAAVPEIYYPVAQNFAQLRSMGSSMVVQSDAPPVSLVGPIRSAIRDVSPTQATFRVETMDQVVRDSLGTHALYLWLLGLFAATGTILAAVGIYGVVAHVVTLRTREFGIRMALGADSRRVIRLIAGRGGALIVLGLAIGSAGALALSRFLTGVLYGVSAADPATFAAMGLLLGAVAMAACISPARRAARVDPAVALRSE